MSFFNWLQANAAVPSNDMQEDDILPNLTNLNFPQIQSSAPFLTCSLSDDSPPNDQLSISSQSHNVALQQPSIPPHVTSDDHPKVFPLAEFSDLVSHSPLPTLAPPSAPPSPVLPIATSSTPPAKLEQMVTPPAPALPMVVSDSFPSCQVSLPAPRLELPSQIDGPSFSSTSQPTSSSIPSIITPSSVSPFSGNDEFHEFHLSSQITLPPDIPPPRLHVPGYGVVERILLARVVPVTFGEQMYVFTLIPASKTIDLTEPTCAICSEQHFDLNVATSASAIASKMKSKMPSKSKQSSSTTTPTTTTTTTTTVSPLASPSVDQFSSSQSREFFAAQSATFLDFHTSRYSMIDPLLPMTLSQKHSLGDSYGQTKPMMPTPLPTNLPRFEATKPPSSHEQNHDQYNPLHVPLFDIHTAYNNDIARPPITMVMCPSINSYLLRQSSVIDVYADNLRPLSREQVNLVVECDLCRRSFHPLSCLGMSLGHNLDTEQSFCPLCLGITTKPLWQTFLASVQALCNAPQSTMPHLSINDFSFNDLILNTRYYPIVPPQLAGSSFISSCHLRYNSMIRGHRSEYSLSPFSLSDIFFSQQHLLLPTPSISHIIANHPLSRMAQLSPQPSQHSIKSTNNNANTTSTTANQPISTSSSLTSTPSSPAHISKSFDGLISPAGISSEEARYRALCAQLFSPAAGAFVTGTECCLPAKIPFLDSFTLIGGGLGGLPWLNDAISSCLNNRLAHTMSHKQLLESFYPSASPPLADAERPPHMQAFSQFEIQTGISQQHAERILAGVGSWDIKGVFFDSNDRLFLGLQTKLQQKQTDLRSLSKSIQEYASHHLPQSLLESMSDTELFHGMHESTSRMSPLTSESLDNSSIMDTDTSNFPLTSRHILSGAYIPASAPKSISLPSIPNSNPSSLLSNVPESATSMSSMDVSVQNSTDSVANLPQYVNQLQYLVKFRSLGHEHDIWVPACLLHAQLDHPCWQGHYSEENNEIIESFLNSSSAPATSSSQLPFRPTNGPSHDLTQIQAVDNITDPLVRPAYRVSHFLFALSAFVTFRTNLHRPFAHNKSLRSIIRYSKQFGTSQRLIDVIWALKHRLVSQAMLKIGYDEKSFFLQNWNQNGTFLDFTEIISEHPHYLDVLPMPITERAVVDLVDDDDDDIDSIPPSAQVNTPNQQHPQQPQWEQQQQQAQQPQPIDNLPQDQEMSLNGDNEMLTSTTPKSGNTNDRIDAAEQASLYHFAMAAEHPEFLETLQFHHLATIHPVEVLATHAYDMTDIYAILRLHIAGEQERLMDRTKLQQAAQESMGHGQQDIIETASNSNTPASPSTAAAGGAGALNSTTNFVQTQSTTQSPMYYHSWQSSSFYYQHPGFSLTAQGTGLPWREPMRCPPSRLLQLPSIPAATYCVRSPATAVLCLVMYSDGHVDFLEMGKVPVACLRKYIQRLTCSFVHDSSIDYEYYPIALRALESTTRIVPQVSQTCFFQETIDFRPIEAHCFNAPHLTLLSQQHISSQLHFDPQIPQTNSLHAILEETKNPQSESLTINHPSQALQSVDPLTQFENRHSFSSPQEVIPTPSSLSHNLAPSSIPTSTPSPSPLASSSSPSSCHSASPSIPPHAISISSASVISIHRSHQFRHFLLTFALFGGLYKPHNFPVSAPWQFTPSILFRISTSLYSLLSFLIDALHCHIFIPRAPLILKATVPMFTFYKSLTWPQNSTHLQMIALLFSSPTPRDAILPLIRLFHSACWHTSCSIVSHEIVLPQRSSFLYAQPRPDDFVVQNPPHLPPIAPYLEPSPISLDPTILIPLFLQWHANTLALPPSIFLQRAIDNCHSLPPQQPYLSLPSLIIAPASHHAALITSLHQKQCYLPHISLDHIGPLTSLIISQFLFGQFAFNDQSTSIMQRKTQLIGEPKPIILRNNAPAQFRVLVVTPQVLLHYLEQLSTIYFAFVFVVGAGVYELLASHRLQMALFPTKFSSNTTTCSNSRLRHVLSSTEITKLKKHQRSILQDNLVYRYFCSEQFTPLECDNLRAKIPKLHYQTVFFWPFAQHYALGVPPIPSTAISRNILSYDETMKTYHRMQIFALILEHEWAQIKSA